MTKNRKTCKYCLNYGKAYKRNYRNELYIRGMCGDCKKPNTEDIYCEECKHHRALVARQRRAKKKESTNAELM